MSITQDPSDAKVAISKADRRRSHEFPLTHLEYGRTSQACSQPNLPWVWESNTLLFDVCFGWAGLCIEPDSKYHTGLREKRSCVLVPECISNVTQTLKFQPGGTGGKVQDGETAINMQCRKLTDMLRKYSNSVVHIDLWSLDVEGYEMTVLESITWSAVSFTAQLIETFWLSDRHVDRYLTERNFVKSHQLAIDSLYLHWAQASDWRPDLWEENWIMNENWRALMREAGKLNKGE